MKYKVGDKTLFGKITDTDKKASRYPYRVECRLQTLWLTEAEIDKIIIKPKRNIDHIIELLEDGKEEAARKFYNDLVPLSDGYAVADEIYYFLKPYTEPIKLTAEERKALELARECGYDLLWYDACFLWAHVRGEDEAKVADDDFPPLRALKGLFPRATNPTSIDSLLEGTI